MNYFGPQTWSMIAGTAIASSIAFWYTNRKKEEKRKKDVFNHQKMNLNLRLINLTSQDIIYYSPDMTRIHTFKPYPRTWTLGLADKSKPQKIDYITANHGVSVLKNGKISIRHWKDWNYIIGLDDRLLREREDLRDADVIVTSDVAEFLFRNSEKYQRVCRHIFIVDPSLLVTTPQDSGIGIKGLVYRGTLAQAKAKYTSLDLYLHLSQAAVQFTK